MAVKKIEELNVHRDVNSTEQFDVQDYLNKNWDKMQDVVDNNAEELMQAQKDISTLKEDNKTNKSSIDVLEKSNETINKSLEDIDTKDKKQDEAIKANKESIEELQAENLEIKSENERLRKDIKSIAIVGEENGESIHIEDSSDARCELEIGGNQQQEIREGYNLLDLSNFSTQTKNGVTATKNEDGSIKLVGTNSGDTFNINLSTINGEIGDYIASGVTEGSRETYFLGIVKPGVKTFAEVTNGSSNFSLTEETTIAANIYIVKGATINTTIYPMLIKGTENKPYEQYGASPSIDYPSPVKSVGDNVNLFPGWEMGTIDVATGNKITDPYYIRSVDFISILPNIDYTIYSINSFGFDSLNTALRLYDKDKKYLGSQYLGEILEKNLTFKITNLDARFMIPTSTNGQKNKIPGNAKVDIKLEKGIIATPYSSYNCGSAKVKLQNRNIMPISSLGTNWEYTDKGIKNTITSAEKEITKFKLKAGQTIKIGFKLFSKPSQDTTFTWYVNNVSNIISSFGHIDRTTFELNKIYTRTYTAEEECVIRSKMFGNANKDIFEFQIWAEYDNLTEYKKYEEQSYLVDVQQEMLEGDYLDLENEKEHHEWEKVVLDGTETWLEVSYGFVIGVTTVDSIFRNRDKTKFDGYSNYLKVEKTSQAWTKINYCGWNTDGAFWIREDHTIAENIDDFKAYLKSKYDEGNPVVVYYQLETPIELDFTDRQKLIAKQIKSEAHTYKNITNISAESAEVNPILNVKYLKDTETEHNKLQAQIDEIKQLLSSTETSSLLLDNIQKDLESEV